MTCAHGCIHSSRSQRPDSVQAPVCITPYGAPVPYLILILIGVTDKTLPASLRMLIMPEIFLPRLALTTRLPLPVSFIFIVPTEPGGMLVAPAAILTIAALSILSLRTTPDGNRSLRATTIVALPSSCINFRADRQEMA